MVLLNMVLHGKVLILLNDPACQVDISIREGIQCSDTCEPCPDSLEIWLRMLRVTMFLGLTAVSLYSTEKDS